MTTLPSFVELMATLGLEQQSARPEAQATTPSSSPSTSPRLSKAAPAKVRSNPALRDTRARPTRYSPYSPALTTRRGSLTGSQISEGDAASQRDHSASPGPRRSSPSSRHPSNRRLSIDAYESTTAISTYARRRTPGASPTSPNFPTSASESSVESPRPLTLTLPTLPSFYSGAPESPPSTTDSDMDIPPFDRIPAIRISKSHDFLSVHLPSQQHGGVRISATNPGVKRRKMSTSS